MNSFKTYIKVWIYLMTLVIPWIVVNKKRDTLRLVIDRLNDSSSFAAKQVIDAVYAQEAFHFLNLEHLENQKDKEK